MTDKQFMKPVPMSPALQHRFNEVYINSTPDEIAADGALVERKTSESTFKTIGGEAIKKSEICYNTPDQNKAVLDPVRGGTLYPHCGVCKVYNINDWEVHAQTAPHQAALRVYDAVMSRIFPKHKRTANP